MNHTAYLVAGFFAFVIGFVLLINASNFLPYYYNSSGCYGGPPSGGSLYAGMAYQIFTGVLVLGGIIALYDGLRSIKLESLTSASNSLATIVAICLILVALFTVSAGLGVSGGGRPFGTTCLAQSGYVCSSPFFSSATGNLIATIGQASGNNWTTRNVVFVPAGISNRGILTSSYFIPANAGLAYNAIAGGLSTGQQVQITIPVNNVVTNKPYYPIGNTVQGTLWAEYTIAGYSYNSSQDYFAQVATVALKAC